MPASTKNKRSADLEDFTKKKADFYGDFPELPKSGEPVPMSRKRGSKKPSNVATFSSSQEAGM
jgi:hypothetical protein